MPLAGVLLDGSPFINTYQRGIARYATEIVRNTDVDCTFLLDAYEQTALPSRARALYRRERFPTSPRNYALRALRKARREFFPTAAPSRSIWHSLYYAEAPRGVAAQIVTVYDLISEVLPSLHGDADREVARRRALLQQVNAVIAISHATGDAFCKLYPEHAGRLHVTHLGADHLIPAKSPWPQNTKADKPYALFVGNRGGYKNWLSLIDAVASSQWPKDLLLRVVGPAFTEAERAAIRYRGITDRIQHRGVLDDCALSSEYQAAAVFVFPSLLEGFGFPMLEAQSHRTPVAASDIGVFHEVGGPAFIPFPPLEPESIAVAVSKASDPQHAAELRDAGVQNVKRFTWAECARKTEAIWQQVMKDTGLR